MNLEAVKQFLTENSEQEEVKSDLEERATVSVDKVKDFLETYEGKKVLQPILDKNFSKGLETWKNNNLEQIVNEEVAKRNPSKTPEQIELERLRKEIEDERNARNREALVNKALKVAKEKNLPDSIVDYFVGQDEETTLANVEKLEAEYSKAVTSAIDSKFKEAGRTPVQGNTNTNTSIDIASLAKEVNIINK